MGHRFFGVLVGVLVLCTSTLTAFAQRNLGVAPPSAPASEQRIALVIGNATYQGSPLKNPVNDARAIAERLQRLGFTVVRRENLKAREIGGALREFRSRLTSGATALFFYAGHGLQVGGVNYLPAVDADIQSEEDVPTQALNVGQVLELMEGAKTRVNLVFLDACRNNPFSRRFRSAAGGLAKIDAASGTLISFATRPGSVAADGDGRNGLYTEYLLKHMEEPGVPIEQVLKRVGSGVKLASKGRQEPWAEGLIEGDFFFRPGIPGVAAGAQAVSAPAFDPAAIELSFWESVKDSKNPDELKNYLDQYPEGRFADLARTRLKAQSAAPASPTQVASLPPSPEVAAKKILGSLVPQYSGGDGLYILDLYYRIRDIKKLEFLHGTFTHGDALAFYAPDGAPGKAYYAGFLCNVPLSDARKIVEALAALGASVTMNEVRPMGGLVKCGGVHG